MKVAYPVIFTDVDISCCIIMGIHKEISNL